MLNDNSFSGVLYIFSFFVAVIGSLIGILILMKQVEIGTLMIMFAIVSGMILFSLGKVLQTLSEIKEEKTLNISQSSSSIQTEENQSEEQLAFTSQSNPVEPKRREENWEVTELEKRNIIEHYGQSGQKVEDIKVTPFARICIVKAEDFIDVIDLVNEYPITLTRSEVEELPELEDWIEENIFGK